MEFNLFIVALLPEYEERIILYLIKAGFTVGPATISNKTLEYDPDTISATIVLKLQTPLKFEVKELIETLKKDLNELGIKYFFISLQNGENIYWFGSNVEISKPIENETGSPYRSSVNV